MRWFRRGHEDSRLEGVLRDARPEPEAAVVRAVVDRVRERARPAGGLAPRTRIGLAIGLVAAGLVVVIPFGGLSLAAGGAHGIGHLVKKASAPGPPGIVAGGPGKKQYQEQCGALAHKICEVEVDPDHPKVKEPKKGSTTVTLDLKLDKPSDGTVSVSYSTQDGSAEAGEDYQAQSGTIPFPAGAKTESVSFTIYADAEDKKHPPDEVFYVNFSATNAVMDKDDNQEDITIQQH